MLGLVAFGPRWVRRFAVVVIVDSAFVIIDTE
jgi:hypothetical protein